MAIVWNRCVFYPELVNGQASPSRFAVLRATLWTTLGSEHPFASDAGRRHIPLLRVEADPQQVLLALPRGGTSWPRGGARVASARCCFLVRTWCFPPRTWRPVHDAELSALVSEEVLNFDPACIGGSSARRHRHQHDPWIWTGGPPCGCSLHQVI